MPAHCASGQNEKIETLLEALVLQSEENAQLAHIYDADARGVSPRVAAQGPRGMDSFFIFRKYRYLKSVENI